MSKQEDKYRCEHCGETERHAVKCPVSIEHQEKFAQALRERRGAPPHEWWINAIPTANGPCLAMINEPEHIDSYWYHVIEKSAYDALKAELVESKEAGFWGRTCSRLQTKNDKLTAELAEVRADNDKLTKEAQTFDVIGRDEAYAEVDRLRERLAQANAEVERLSELCWEKEQQVREVAVKCYREGRDEAEDSLRDENALLKQRLERFTGFDRARGYPTGTEWISLIEGDRTLARIKGEKGK